jgi:ankyrin repeat protein
MTAIHRRVAVTALLGLLAGRALADANTDEFFRAIRQDNDAAVRSLLARGFNPNTKDEKGTPGLIVALQEGALRVASLLIDSPRLVPETRNAADESPLMMAALKGHVEHRRRLIAQATPTSTSRAGRRCTTPPPAGTWTSCACCWRSTPSSTPSRPTAPRR